MYTDGSTLFTYGSGFVRIDTDEADDVDDDDDVEEDDEEDDRAIDKGEGTIDGRAKGETRFVCSSAALARRRTLAICSCSSRFKWLKSNSAGDAGGGGIEAIVG